MRVLRILSWVEVALLVGLLASYFAGQISAPSVAFAVIGVMVVFAPVAFLLLAHDPKQKGSA